VPGASSEFQTIADRRRAWRDLFVNDHGLLRLFYDNSHDIDGGTLWRSYQPSPARLARWKEHGIRTVINLRGESDKGRYRLEREACERLGLTLVDFRVYSREAPSREIIHGAKALFDRIDYPALIHCKSGADRAGMMATLYRFFVCGDAMDTAMEQLSFRYGHVRQGKTGVIDAAFNAFIAHAAANSIDLTDQTAFLEWVDGPYDPAEIKRSFRPQPLGSFLTETLLKRE